jgi:hypothetical protein
MKLMRILVFVLLMVVCERAFGDSSSLNLALPNSSGSYASDRIRAGNLECSNAIGGATALEFGVVGILNQNGPYDNRYGSSYTIPDNYDSNDLIKDVGVYAKITIPLDKPKERLNCNTLYKLELERRRLEIQKLQAEVAQLRSLQFADDEE